MANRYMIRHEVQLKEFLKHGPGVMMTSSGSFYEGYWKADEGDPLINLFGLKNDTNVMQNDVRKENEELKNQSAQWKCKKCTFINTVEFWTDDYYSRCSMC